MTKSSLAALRTAIPRRIAIVGAGTAGATSAIALARAGHDVAVFEQVADPKPVGAGITLQPTGQAALAALGLLDRVLAHGARIDRLKCTRRGGGVLVSLDYGTIHAELFGLGLHRGVLFELLFSAARDAGAKLHCGTRIAASHADRDGRWLVADDGSRHGPYELVVCADGSVCELHDQAPRVRSRPYAWGALWIVASDPGLAAARTLMQVVDGPRRMLGLLPTGRDPEGREVTSLFWSLRADRVDAWRRAGLHAWRDEVIAFDRRAAPIVEPLADLDAVLFTRYRDVSMWPYHGDRIVFIGDAAHAMSPQLGQGANLALVDAVTLVDALARSASVDDALPMYSRARRRHLAFYGFATRLLTPMFQGDSRMLGWMRDLGFAVARWIPWVDRRMVRTMIGIERGLVRRGMPLQDLLARRLPPA
jgi:2-polyprenyl-6-methoxyphenol hydroxylase-like FAD-dependent oxidoreductase